MDKIERVPRTAAGVSEAGRGREDNPEPGRLCDCSTGVKRGKYRGEQRGAFSKSRYQAKEAEDQLETTEDTTYVGVQGRGVDPRHASQHLTLASLGEAPCGSHSARRVTPGSTTQGCSGGLTWGGGLHSLTVRPETHHCHFPKSL